MARYRVSFFKDLVSSDGHPFKCIQKVIEIRHARSPDRAVKCAELRYDRLHRVHDRMLHSDYLELEIEGKKVDYRPLRVAAKAAGKMPGLQEAAPTKAVFKRCVKTRETKLSTAKPED
jgi:hypothetical protein